MLRRVCSGLLMGSLFLTACVDPTEMEALKQNQAQLLAKMERIEKKLDALHEEMQGEPAQEEPDTPIVDRGPEDQEILAVLRAHRREVKDCLKLGAAEGTATVRLTIQPDGRAQGIRITPAHYMNSEFGRCLLKAVEAWTFPKHSGAPISIDFPVRINRG